MGLPEAPWALSGELVVAVVRHAADVTVSRPCGVARLPGPLLLWGAHWHESPVGPFSELALAAPSRLGLRPGLCVVVAVVSSAQARSAGRLVWGFPSEAGDLRWGSDGAERVLAWADRGIEVRVTPKSRSLPLRVALRSPQRRADGPVMVPSRLQGRVKRAAIDVVIPPGDALSALAGRHGGVDVAAHRLILDPARRPSGLLRTLTAPLREPEAGLEPGFPLWSPQPQLETSSGPSPRWPALQ